MPFFEVSLFSSTNLTDTRKGIVLKWWYHKRILSLWNVMHIFKILNLLWAALFLMKVFYTSEIISTLSWAHLKFLTYEYMVLSNIEQTEIFLTWGHFQFFKAKLNIPVLTKYGRVIFKTRPFPSAGRKWPVVHALDLFFLNLKNKEWERRLGRLSWSKNQIFLDSIGCSLDYII